MARRRSTSKSPAWPMIPVAAVLIVGGYLALDWQQRQQSVGMPLEQTADLVSDDRLIFGGAPRPMPGAGEETRFSVLKNRGYIAGYSDWRRNPLWVSYRVYKADPPFDLPRPSAFKSDERTAARVKESDYARSGYQRGHMAPNAAIMRQLGREAQLETFLLSNICPQTPELNEKVWERLEVEERKYGERCEEVWVIDGPIFADLNGGVTARLASGIAVPSAFYKIVIDEEGQKGGAPRVFAVIMPQDVKGAELPQQYMTTVSEIQKQTRLDFLWKLEDRTEGELEGTKWKMW